MSNWIGEAYVNADGSWTNVDSSMSSVTRMSAGVYKCVCDNSQNEADVYATIEQMEDSASTDRVRKLVPQYVDESGKPGVIARFVKESDGTPIDCRFRVTFEVKD